MHMKGHVRSFGTSRGLKLMVNLQMVSVDMIKNVKERHYDFQLS